MRTLITASATLLLQFCCAGSNAQTVNSRPKLFTGVESKISYPKAELERIFTKNKGTNYNISLPGNFKFTGIVVSSVQRYNNLQSSLIKSSVLDGAMFIISKRVNDDNSVTYVGRIINEKYSDGYELKSDEAGNYYLNKLNMDDILEDKK